MSFLTWAALAIGALIVAPLAAHLLRRRPPRTERFAAAHLVPPSPAVARRRPTFEDRALLGLRVVAVVLLALLGATPFVRCERLSLARRGGASVALAIVLDDSLSMRATTGGAGDEGGRGDTRFERALEATRELVAGLQAGDAVAVVLAGRPARVALGATTELGTVAALLERLAPSDRATDLDDALARATEALRPLPHVDKRVVLLSDLWDGQPGDPPLAAPDGVELWAPLEALRRPIDDCAVLQAELVSGRVVARVACIRGARLVGEDAGADTPAAVSPPASGSASSRAQAAAGSAAPSSQPEPPGTRSSPASRTIELRAGGRLLSEATVQLERGAMDIALPLEGSGTASRPAGDTAVADAQAPSRAEAPAVETLVVALTPGDAIAADDAAPVHDRSRGVGVGIVADAARGRPPTGGPPPVEQAVAALGHGIDLRLLGTVPEQPETLAELGALIVDDVPGFTPEARRALAAWLEGGGVMLLTLGPRSAEAPLGAGFEPMVPGVVRWERLDPRGSASVALDGGTVPAAAAPSSVRGIDLESAELFGPTAEGLGDLAPIGRVLLELRPGSSSTVRARWSDGRPLLLEQRLGRGICLTLGLPLTTDESDLALRPGFLVLLEHVVDVARGMGGASRVFVGTTWTFEGYEQVQVERMAVDSLDRPETLEVQHQSGVAQVAVARRGAYQIDLGDRRARRVAVLDEQELLAEPRSLPDGATASELGGVGTALDISRYLAFALLLLLAAELGLRLWQARERSAAS